MREERGLVAVSVRPNEWVTKYHCTEEVVRKRKDVCVLALGARESRHDSHAMPKSPPAAVGTAVAAAASYAEHSIILNRDYRDNSIIPYFTAFLLYFRLNDPT